MRLSRSFLLSASLSLLRLLFAFSSASSAFSFFPFCFLSHLLRALFVPARASLSRVLLYLSASSSHQLSSPPPTSLLLLTLIRSRWGWVHDVTCGNCQSVLRELSTKPPPHLLRALSCNEGPQPPSSHGKRPVTLFFIVPCP